MRKADWIFAAGTIAVILFFIWLSSTGSKPTPLSALPQHQTAKTRQDCLSCHNPETAVALKPIPKEHPQAWKDERFQCTVCHLQAK
jgi:nitrate/TMAO reductase-like tetraheme cytochrome c subunit